jgi:uncharacterized protein (UPF0335 family)
MTTPTDTVQFGDGPKIPITAAELRAAAKQLGHNSVQDDRLRSIVDRIARLSGEKADIAVDIADIYKEAKSAGYDPKAIRIVVKHQLASDEQRVAREATEAEADRMKAALGMLADTPLGKAARGE